MAMNIDIRGLKKRFGDLVIYDGLDLSIPKGQLAVILGRSGSGKSVMLKHLVGLLRPDAGTIEIDGVDISRMGERDLDPVRRRFGMIFQNGGMLQSLTVGDNVALPLVESKGCAYAEVAGRVAECLERVGLEGREAQPVSTLSGGQRKRVAIARALIQDADCFLFDEPTAGLDPPMSANVDEIIRQVNQETGATVLVVTHDLVSAFELGDRIYLLHEGHIVEAGTAAEFARSTNPLVVEFLARGGFAKPA